MFGRVWFVCMVGLGSDLAGGLWFNLGLALCVVFRVVGVFLFVCFVVDFVFASWFGFAVCGIV